MAATIKQQNTIPPVRTIVCTTANIGGTFSALIALLRDAFRREARLVTVIQRWSRNLGLALRRRTCSDGKGNRLAEAAESEKTRKDHMARRKANVQLRRSMATKTRVDLIENFVVHPMENWPKE